MKNANTYNFLVVKLITYSFLLIAVLALSFVAFTGFNITQIISVDPSYAMYSVINSIYIPVFFLLLLILDLCFILIKKIWAFYLFYLLMAFLFVILLIQSPVDWLNVILLIFLTVIFAIANQKLYRLKKINLPQKENSEEFTNKGK